MKELLAKLVDVLVTALFDALNWLWEGFLALSKALWDLVVDGLGALATAALDALGLSGLFASVGDWVGALAGPLVATFPEFATVWSLAQAAIVGVFSWYVLRWTLKLIPTIDG